MKTKLTKSILRKLIKEEVQNAVKEVSAGGSTAQQKLAAIVGNLSSMEIEAIADQKSGSEKAQEIKAVLSNLPSREKMMAALSAALDNIGAKAGGGGHGDAGVNKAHWKKIVMRAFFGSGRYSVIPAEPMQESNNISLKLKNRRATHPIAKGRSIFS